MSIIPFLVFMRSSTACGGIEVQELIFRAHHTSLESAPGCVNNEGFLEFTQKALGSVHEVFWELCTVPLAQNFSFMVHMLSSRFPRLFSRIQMLVGRYILPLYIQSKRFSGQSGVTLPLRSTSWLLVSHC
jgi:hypothetical protein